MTYQEIIKTLKSKANPKNVEGMSRFGITASNKLGIRIPVLRSLAKEIGKNHKLALQLWNSKIHEAKILASMIDEIDKVTKTQMDSWIKDFDSWDVCDQVCMNLFDKTPYAFKKAVEWTKRKSEFEKRAGFALMACLAWHDKTSPDRKFAGFFPYIKINSTDKRNFVKKAVNWALRQIGKRNRNLNKEAINVAKAIYKTNNKTAKWIANDALKELSDSKTQQRLVKLLQPNIK